MDAHSMNDAQYGLLFDVRRSIRYHDRRFAFFERLHQITAGLTILLAGSVLFDVAKAGETAPWMIALSVVAALLSVWDMVVGYSSKAGLHRDLKLRFSNLEISILEGDDSATTWQAHKVERLKIEQNEPPVFRGLDTLCHNELLRAEGVCKTKNPGQYKEIGRWKRVTRHFFHWADIA